MLYYVKFAGIQYPLDSSFTPKMKELVLCELNGEHFIGSTGEKIYADLKSKGKNQFTSVDMLKGVPLAYY